MLEELLKKCFDEEQAADRSAEDIKTAVLSRIEEDKNMKHFSVKPLIIAAAIAATGAVSVVTANAATDGAVIDGIVRTISLWVGGVEVTGRVTEYTAEDGNTYERIWLELPESAEVGAVVDAYFDEAAEEVGADDLGDIGYIIDKGEAVDTVTEYTDEDGKAYHKVKLPDDADAVIDGYFDDNAVMTDAYDLGNLDYITEKSAE